MSGRGAIAGIFKKQSAAAALTKNSRIHSVAAQARQTERERMCRHSFIKPIIHAASFAMLNNARTHTLDIRMNEKIQTISGGGGGGRVRSASCQRKTFPSSSSRSRSRSLAQRQCVNLKKAKRRFTLREIQFGRLRVLRESSYVC
jgi:hypothetical protein